MKYGLIGEKLGHSFSKEIHEQIADYTYELCPLTREACKAFMEKKAFTAINVTIPYKKDVIPYLDEMDDNAKAIGAVNTIVHKDGKLIGHNTDFTGFLYMLIKHKVDCKDKKVIVIGNGGASAAIQAVLAHEQAGEVIIVKKKSSEDTITYEECYQKHRDATILINTSPVGMYPNINDSPIDLTKFTECSCVIDVIYNPIKTRLCLSAQALGIQYIAGLEMLVAQAKQAVEFFLETSIDESVIDTIYQDMMMKQCNIVLIGMPSAGKTTIGKLLAKRLNKTFIDMDDEIIKKAGMQIPEIFASVQEKGFRLLESDVTQTLSRQNNMIIATGGGVIKDKANMDALRLNGITIFLDRAFESLISFDPNRPLSKNEEALRTMYNERYPLYQKYSDIKIKNIDTVEHCVDEILTLLNTTL